MIHGAFQELQETLGSKLGRHGQQLNGASVKTGMEKGKGLGKETEHSLEKTS